MEQKYSVKLAQVAADHDLKVVFASSDYNDKLIRSADLNRPGVQMLGHLEYFDTERLQIIGKGEKALLAEMTPEQRLRSFEILMENGIPALIVAHDESVPPEALQAAKKHDISVLTSDVDTSEFYAQLIGTLRRYLAPRRTIHGVLVEVYGEGVLITGDSGVGKSEAALELIKRGHRLIADDAVELLRTSRSTLEGRSPGIIRYFMEVRGIGIINVLSVYGVGSVRSSCPIDMEISLQYWKDGQVYDRLGLEQEKIEYLGVPINRTTVPVRPGRNLAVIIELAAMVNRQKKFGYNAAEELTRRIDEQIDNGIEF